MEDANRLMRVQAYQERAEQGCAMRRYLLLAAGSQVFTTPAMAELSAQISASSRNVPSFSQSLARDNGPVSLTRQFADGLGVSSFVDYGIHKMDAISFDFAGPGSGINPAGVQASSFWRDNLVVNSAARTGVVEFAIDIRGSQSVAGNVTLSTANMGYTLIATRDSQNLGQFSLSFITATQPGASSFTIDGRPAAKRFGRYTLRVPFESGREFLVTSQAVCGASATDFQIDTIFASAHCRFGDSIYWSGVSQVLGEDGHPIVGWTLSSRSGTDYTRSFEPQHVPEPASWAMLIAGFGLAGAAARRRVRVAHA
jgi:hypothetical protein